MDGFHELSEADKDKMATKRIRQSEFECQSLLDSDQAELAKVGKKQVLKVCALSRISSMGTEQADF